MKKYSFSLKKRQKISVNDTINKTDKYMKAMKAMIFSIIRTIISSFVLSLMVLTLETENIIHVLFSFPVFFVVFYIGMEGLPKSNKLNKEKDTN